MARPFPNPGRIVYNGVYFPSAFKTSVRLVPVPTSDGRTIKYREYHIHVESVWVSDDFQSGSINAVSLGFALPAGAPVDQAMEAVRRRLMVNGKPLKYTNVGIGRDLLVSAAGLASAPVGGVQGVYPDVAFGPRVVTCEWVSAGDNLAAMLVWDCVVTLACEDTFNSSESAVLNQFGELCWSIGFSINEQGLTTRTITGSAETAVYRTDTRGITSTADILRPLIRFPLLQGFARDQNWPISPDKRQIEFQIIDRELPSENPLYPGCVKMNLRHRASSGLGGGGGYRLWTSMLSGSIELAPGVERGVAWLAFLTVLNDRMGQANANVSQNVEPDAGLTYISRVEIEESIYTREFFFSVTWGVTSRLSAILNRLGMWRPSPGTWADWLESMGQPDGGQLNPQSVYGPLGLAALRHQATDDVIVDFCEPLNQPQRSDYQPPTTTAVYRALQPECPPPEESSWVRYDYRVEFDRQTNAVFHSQIGSGDALQTTSISPAAPDSLPSYALDGPSDPSTAGAVKIQATGPSIVRATLIGSAVRIGRRITAPSIVAIGLSPAVLESEQVSDNDLTGYTGDCPIYHLRWRRTYCVYKPSGSIQIDGVPERFKDTVADDTP